MSMPVEGSLDYLAILILISIALVISTAMLVVNKIFGKVAKENTAKKYETYECGVTVEGSAHQQFSVRYYLIGIVFLIFDVEVVFMYPWTIVYQTYLKLNPMILWQMILFVAILFGGYLYLRLRGALNWD